jgi:cytochrome c6
MRRLALILCGCAALLAGCGGERTASPTPNTVEGSVPQTTTTSVPPTTGDPVAGKVVFNNAGCSGCHTLMAAGATGTIGPNLDDKKPPLSLVLERVENGKSPMPSFKDTLSSKQIADVAAFVVKSTQG